MYAVIVRFAIDVMHVEKFRGLVLFNAEQSLSKEEGCRVFDVCEMGDGEFWLYELYDDHEAFQLHLRTPHFLQFDAQATTWILEKSVRTGQHLAKTSSLQLS